MEAFLKLLPHVSAALPEYFRALSVAHHSIEQKNMFNQPQGIHQSTGLTSSLNLLLVAMVNDRVIGVNADLVKFIDALRILVLKWYSFGNDLKACVYFGYYYYTHKSASEHEVRQQLDAILFLVDESSRVSQDPQHFAIAEASEFKALVFRRKPYRRQAVSAHGASR